MRERGSGWWPPPPGVFPFPRPVPSPPILSRRPMCSVMLTLLLFSLSFREKKRRRIEELLAEKLVLPGGRGPLRGPPPPLTPGLGDQPQRARGAGRGAPGAQAARSRSRQQVPFGPARCLTHWSSGTVWRPVFQHPSGQRRDLVKRESHLNTPKEHRADFGLS